MQKHNLSFNELPKRVEVIENGQITYYFKFTPPKHKILKSVVLDNHFNVVMVSYINKEKKNDK